VTATVPCNARSKHCPQPGTKCGWRERESRREGRREQSLRDKYSFARRGGERHPGFLEGGTLRGVSSERRPRSVRALRRVSPRSSHRTDDSGCPKEAKEGNVVGMRHKAYALDRCGNHCISFEDASFAWSFDPCTSILTMHCGASFGGGAVDSASRLGKPTEVGETSTGAERTGVARLAACHSFPRGRARDTSRKGRRSRSPSLRGSRVRVRLPAHRWYVAEVGRRRLVSNKLGKRAPKRAARVE
jgi:hypothetical protein